MKKIILFLSLILLLTGCNDKNIEISDSAYTTMNIFGAEVDTTDFVDLIINDGLSASAFENFEEYINEKVDEKLEKMLDQCDNLSGNELRECLWEVK